MRREGNYRDSSLYNWYEEDSSSEAEAELDEYEQYLSEKVVKLREDESILQYWNRNSQKWPHLSRLAYDAISIPAMSAECERCFSSGKNLITSNRWSLAPATIEACECERHWFMHKSI